MAQVKIHFNSKYYVIYFQYIFKILKFYSLAEKGSFLALDLGGTNFRTLLIELGENNFFRMKSEIYSVPPSIQTGEGTEVIKYYLINC